MIGILVALAISWLLLAVLEKESLLALGILPFAKRSKQFLFGFLVTTTLCFLAQYFESFLQSSKWVLNEQITAAEISNGIRWDFISVLTEELIFRGALLYILIQRIGPKKSILISAIAFGIYHWFSFGILGNILPMILIFIGTGLMGYGLASAFSKTNSIMLPFGLHLGWNFTYNTIFSKGPLGDLLLVSNGGHELSDWTSLLNFVSGMIIVPLFVIMYVKYFIHEEKDNGPIQ